MSNTNHPWCSNTARDEAIRAAEDDAANWRRLEAGEVIEDGDEFLSSMDGKWRRTAAIGTPAVGSITYRRRRVPLPDHRELPQAVAELRERVVALEDHFADASKMVTTPQPAPVPPAPASRPAETRQTQAKRVQSQAEPWKWWNPMPSSCGASHPTPDAQPSPVPPSPATRPGETENADGLRTERVTLEITQRAESYAPCRDLDWQRMLRQTPGGLFPGESVRVVEESESDEAVAHGATLNALTEARESLAAANRGIARLKDERDAALRERDAAEGECDHLRNHAVVLRTTIENLHSVIRERDQEIGTLKARVAELEGAPAANAGGDSKQEPVAWGVKSAGEITQVALLQWRDSLITYAESLGGTVVPLYAAPQPPRGWLTAEEMAALEEAMVDYASNVGDNECERIERVLRALLARSTPPMVKVPGFVAVEDWHTRDRKWIAAIREAGGEVE